MANNRHSFVALYPSNWLAGTARMTRLVKSVYFDICMYNWDKNEPCPEAEIVLMLADLEGQGERILNQLVKAGKLKQNPDGGVYNEKAMEEAGKAFAAYSAKSKGGKIARNNDAGKAMMHQSLQQSYEESCQQSCDHSSIELRDKTQDSKQAEDSAPAALVISPSENDPQTEGKPVEPDPEEAEEPEEEVPTSAISKEDIDTMADAWNTMAITCGVPQVNKLTEDRRKKMRARLKEHGIDTIVEAFRTIPASAFLTGKRGDHKTSFDSVLAPKYMNKLIEGAYHSDGGGSAWR